MRYSFWGRAVDTFGNVQLSEGITVYLEGTETPATVYTQQIGGSGISTAPQVSTDSAGRVDFWIDNDDYSLTQLFDIVVSGLTYTKVDIFRAANVFSVSAASVEQDNRVREYAETLESPSANIINRANEYTDVLRVEFEDVDGQLATHLASGSVHFLESSIEFDNIGISAHKHPEYDAMADTDELRRDINNLTLPTSASQEDLDNIRYDLNTFTSPNSASQDDLRYEINQLTLPTSASQEDLDNIRYDLNTFTSPNSASQDDLRYEIHNLTLPTSASQSDVLSVSAASKEQDNRLQEQIDLIDSGPVSAASREQDNRLNEFIDDNRWRLNTHASSGGIPILQHNQNLTTYTEVDTSYLTVTSQKVEFANMPRNVDSYLYKNFGGGFFSDFEIEFEFEITASQTSSLVMLTAVSNTIGNMATMDTANDGIHCFAFNEGGSMKIKLQDESNKNQDIYTDGGTTTNLLYCIFKRIGTTATLEIYSDSGRETLIDTLTITCETGTKRYLYAIASYDSAVAADMTGYTQNFAIPSASGVFDPIHFTESSIDIGNIAVSAHAHPQYDGDISSETVDTNAIGIGALLVLSSDGNYDEADADTAATCGLLALAAESGTGTKEIMNQGWMYIAGHGFTVGVRLYVSTTQGEMTNEAPDGSGNVVQVVGYAKNENVIRFNPSPDFLVVA